MIRSRWTAAGMCIAAAVGVAWGLDFFFDHLMSKPPTSELGYDPMGDNAAPMDMGAVQRGWPNAMHDPSERARMMAFMHGMGSREPMPIAAPTTQPQAAPVDLGTLLADADPQVGQAKAQVCASCHDFTQGGPNRIGPNLWGVVGRDIGSHAGFAYSDAMKSEPGNWSYAELFDYLASPARDIPGNKMGFAGLRKPEDRAAVIRYLATLGGSAPPLPRPKQPIGETAAQ
ncbi:cytochrome c family protein [Novosphingobium sp. KN65.2]|uniref:c-type cytochrome n=1 Tax=Novosphingobium sp. KN65.2 TaxID=1478134 RepID=UPI0006D55F6A|nr:cytochrome c family protein [Novosphingobium sp. KN65.2]